MPPGIGTISDDLVLGDEFVTAVDSALAAIQLNPVLNINQFGGSIGALSTPV